MSKPSSPRLLRLGAATLAAAALACVAPQLAAAGCSPAKKSRAAPLRVGINANTQGYGDKAGQEQDRVAPLGVGWLREDFSWSVIQPEEGRYDWGHYDRVLLEAARRGLRVLPLLASAPGWAEPTANTIPADPRDYASFVAHVVRRYGPGGALWRDHAALAGCAPTHFEIWNEPYLDSYSDDGVDPGRYARLVKASVIAGRRANPRAKYLIESDTAATYLPGQSFDFTDSMYAAVPHLGRYFDAVAVHPYTRFSPAFYDPKADTRLQFGRIREIHARFKRHGDGHKHLWITEVGWSTCAAAPVCVSESRQATDLRKLFEVVRSRYRSYVDALFVFNFRDYGPAVEDSKEGWFGVLRRDGSRKPSWQALRSAVTSVR